MVIHLHGKLLGLLKGSRKEVCLAMEERGAAAVEIEVRGLVANEPVLIAALRLIYPGMLFALTLPFDICPGTRREATRSPVCMLTCLTKGEGKG